jgi:hypothetical protein
MTGTRVTTATRNPSNNLLIPSPKTTLTSISGTKRQSTLSFSRTRSPRLIFNHPQVLHSIPRILLPLHLPTHHLHRTRILDLLSPCQPRTSRKSPCRRQTTTHARTIHRGRLTLHHPHRMCSGTGYPRSHVRRPCRMRSPQR